MVFTMIYRITKTCLGNPYN